MAVHQVKVHCQQLVTDEDNRAEKAIVNALITLARSMKLPLIGTILIEVKPLILISQWALA
jgi:hypothetical protein